MKPTNKAQYLDPNSCHAAHQSKNIPYSLAYRIRRICTEDTQFEFRLTNLKQDLINRNYHNKIIDDAFEKVRKIPRKQALKKVEKKSNERSVFVVTYHPALPSVSNVLKKHWNVMVDGNQELK